MKQNTKQLNLLLRKKYGIVLSDEELFSILDFYSDFIVDLVAEDSR